MKKLISFVFALALIGLFAVCAQARSVGDVDKNGLVNSIDALKVLNYAVGLEKDIDTKTADVNLDGTINSNDALIVLQTAVGLLDEIKDCETPVCKTTYLDPIFKTEKYTIEMNSVYYNGETIIINGSNAADVIDTKWFKEISLYKNGKNYNILPEHKKYAELPTQNNIADNFKKYLTNLTYVGTTVGTLNQKTYRCEIFKSSDDCICKFYFSGTNWEYLIVTDSTGKSNVMASQIRSFSGSVDEALFSLNGYEKMDIDSFENFMSDLMKK